MTWASFAGCRLPEIASLVFHQYNSRDIFLPISDASVFFMGGVRLYSC